MQRARKTKPAATRLAKHRAEMRRRGFKLVQLWVPDLSSPGFKRAVEQSRKFLEVHPDPEWDAYVRKQLDDAPGWDDT
jgi:hypothetical protein